MATSSTRRFYLVLALIGLVVPYTVFGLWLVRYGVDPRRFVGDLFANGISTFFALDVIISVIVLLSLVRRTPSLTPRQRWGVILGALCVGGSFGLPLYLYFEAQQETSRVNS